MRSKLYLKVLVELRMVSTFVQGKGRKIKTKEHAIEITQGPQSRNSVLSGPLREEPADPRRPWQAVAWLLLRLSLVLSRMGAGREKGTGGRSRCEAPSGGTVVITSVLEG